MCVIIVKPQGVEMPSEAILRAAGVANPHGCGFVSSKRYFRSLSLEKFMCEIRKIDKNDFCIIHFRLATHGSVKQSNCHPFRNGNVFFAHNGILSINPRGDMTDSQTAFNDVIYPAIQKYGYGSALANMAVENVRGGYSKFAIVRNNKLMLYGNFEQMDGCYYSNFRFLPYVTRYSA